MAYDRISQARLLTEVSPIWRSTQKGERTITIREILNKPVFDICHNNLEKN